MRYLRIAALCAPLLAGYCVQSIKCKDGDVYDEAISKCRKIIKSSMLRYGVPGAVVAVAVNGRIVWSEGMGLADVENNVPCSEDTVMRIASISKSLTAVAVAKVWQQGKLDLDAPIQKYVETFPEKSVGGVPVTIKLRQLLSHMAGIRHYGSDKEFLDAEYYIKEHYNTVNDSLELFCNDELLSSPGTSFHYTTHGWTLISAALEAAMGKPFLQVVREEVLCPLHMTSTTEELHSPLILNRGRHYYRDSSGQLCNVPYVDNSYKWAGGGYISTATDLVKFGSALLAAYHHTSEDGGNPLLLPTTVAKMWQMVVKMSENYYYGWGWMIIPSAQPIAGVSPSTTFIGHTGGAIGASSALLLAPRSHDPTVTPTGSHDPIVTPTGSHDPVATPNNIAVAIIFNLQEVPKMFQLGQTIAEHFM